MTRDKHSRGTTLVELMVVLAILSLTLALALPYSRHSGEARKFTALTQTVAAELRNMRMRAIAENRETVLSLDLEGRTVSTSPGGPVTEIPADVDVTVLTAAGEVSRRDTGFRFFPDGTATGGRIDFTFGKRKTILAINWLTGAVVRSEETAK